MFVTELFTEAEEMRKLVAVFRKGPTVDNPKAVASKIYLWKTGPGDNTYEMEVGQDRKRIPVKLSFAQIRQTLAKKGFNESITRIGRMLIESAEMGTKGQRCVRCKKGTYQETSIQDDMQGVLHCTNCGYEVTNPGNVTEARREWDDPVDLLSVRGTDRDALGRNLPKKAKARELKKDIINSKGKHGPKGKLPEASMTNSVPSKKESVFNKGVEKSLGQQVAVIVLDHPDSVAYGVFKRIGETGLCHIKLNGGKIEGWASGDMIAVRPSEVYSTWDPRLQGKTAVHREYSDTGEKTVREEKWSKLPSGDYRNTETGRAYAKKGGGPDNGGNSSYMTPEYLISHYKKRIAEIEAGPYKRPREVAQLQKKIAKLSGQRSYMLHHDGSETPVRENNKPKVTDVKTGKQYDPKEETEKMYSDPEYIAQMQRMGREEGRGWPKRSKDGSETPVREGETDPRKKYPNSLFPEKTAENKRAAALKRLKAREWRKIKGDNSGGESNIGSPVGSSSNDY